MYLTRACLVDPPGAGVPGIPRSGLLDAHHRLVWSLFPQGNNRDFLFREIAKSRFLILSARHPLPSPELRLMTEEYALDFDTDSGLAFKLRVNATRAVRNSRGRGSRTDIVMDELSRSPPGSGNRTSRLQAARAAAPRWLADQGRKHGFDVNGEDVSVDRYHVMKASRKSGRPAVFGVIDVRGTLTVTDPCRMSAAVRNGFGRARAFGCGLMLLSKEESQRTK